MPAHQHRLKAGVADYAWWGWVKVAAENGAACAFGTCPGGGREAPLMVAPTHVGDRLVRLIENRPPKSLCGLRLDDRRSRAKDAGGIRHNKTTDTYD